MTCLEAQSNIMAFIDKKLPDDKTADFVRHMRFCPNCAEELEIYYTLIVGIREVDNNEDTSKDYKKELQNELDKAEHKIKKAKRFKISTFSVFFIAIVILTFIVYSRILYKVNFIEQNMIKLAQGDYYFYLNLGDDLLVCKEDFIDEFNERNENETVQESTFYELIREYEILHPKDNVKEDDEEKENMSE